MLTLKNITINSKTAEADYFPEAEVEASHIVVDLENAEIMSLFEGKGSWEMYSSHAMQALIHMAREKDKSTERLVMWY
jgi:hypothetical protein